VMASPSRLIASTAGRGRQRNEQQVAATGALCRCHESNSVSRQLPG
jgi:hypothetical protein